MTGWMDFLGKPFFKEHGNCLWTTIIEYMKTVETDFRQQDNINFFLLEMSSFFFNVIFLTLQAPTPPNGQTHSNNSSLSVVGLGLKGLKINKFKEVVEHII